MWLLQTAFWLVPCLTGAFAIALFLARRPVAAPATWLGGLLVIAFLVAAAVAGVYVAARGVVPASSLIKAFALQYYIPFVVLTGAAFRFRARVRSRHLGVALLIVLFLIAGTAASYAAGHYFDIVVASG